MLHLFFYEIFLAEYYLLEGYNEMWRKHKDVTPLQYCCDKLTWMFNKQTCTLGITDNNNNRIIIV